MCEIKKLCDLEILCTTHGYICEANADSLLRHGRYLGLRNFECNQLLEAAELLTSVESRSPVLVPLSEILNKLQPPLKAPSNAGWGEIVQALVCPLCLKPGSAGWIGAPSSFKRHRKELHNNVPCTGAFAVDAQKLYRAGRFSGSYLPVKKQAAAVDSSDPSTATTMVQKVLGLHLQFQTRTVAAADPALATCKELFGSEIVIVEQVSATTVPAPAREQYQEWVDAAVQEANRLPLFLSQVCEVSAQDTASVQLCADSGVDATGAARLAHPGAA
jgi:hypothetical protein